MKKSDFIIICNIGVIMAILAGILNCILDANEKLDIISQKLDTLDPYQFTVIKEVPAEEMSFTETFEFSDPDISTLFEKDIPYLAKTVWGEARGCSKTQQAAVVWCILNRVDDDRWPDDIIEVVTSPGQFAGYSDDYPVEDDIYDLVVDVLTRWWKESNGETDVGRILPKEYQYFYGDGTINHFTRKSGGTVGGGVY